MPRRVEIGVVTSDKTAKTRRVEIPRLVKDPQVRKIPPPPDGLLRARREQRVARRRHGGDRRVPADVAAEALEAGARGGEGAAASDLRRGRATAGEAGAGEEQASL